MCLGPCPEGHMEGSDRHKMEGTTKALSLSVLRRLKKYSCGKSVYGLLLSLKMGTKKEDKV